MQLPSPLELQAMLPSSYSSFIQETRNTLHRLLTNEDQRFLFIIGPCSIHDEESALAYAEKFHKLARDVEESCFLLMRAYGEKPRTTTGWKGFLYDPTLDGSCDLREGLMATRKLFLKLCTMGVPIGCEFVDPLVAPYMQDLISWGSIGARTCASQTHRQLASQLAMPIGFKNSIEGSIDLAIQGMLAASTAHTFFHLNPEGRIAKVQSQGNPWTHLVLRGSSEGPNYDATTLFHSAEKLRAAGLIPRILIDCAHGNCQKDPRKQIDAYSCILRQREEGNDNILGMMLESHLSSMHSLTDPCIDWATTENLIHYAHELSSTWIRSTQS